MYKPKYFKETEFYNYEKMNIIFIFILDKLRQKFSRILPCFFEIISSNNPNEKHSDGSKHYSNEAVDFVIKHKANKNIIGLTNQYIIRLLFGYIKELEVEDNCGIGVYINSKGIMSIHLDYREKAASWMALSKNNCGDWNYEKLDILKITN